MVKQAKQQNDSQISHRLFGTAALPLTFPVHINSSMATDKKNLDTSLETMSDAHLFA